MGKKIALVGMMASGKSTVGRMAAERLRRRFIDADLEIERRAGATVAEYFSRFGEAAFREAERVVTLEALAGGDDAVIAAGGGAFIQPGLREILKRNSTVVFLEVEEKELVRRLEEIGPAGRPVLGGDRWRERLSALVRERYSAYREAEVRLAVGREPPEVTAERLLGLLRDEG